MLKLKSVNELAVHIPLLIMNHSLQGHSRYLVLIVQSVRALKMGIMELYRNHVEGKFKLINPDKPLQEEQYHQREILERKVEYNKTEYSFYQKCLQFHIFITIKTL